MTAETNMDDLIHETQRYEFGDGLRDLQLAVLLVVGGLTVWLSFEPMWFTFLGALIQQFGRGIAWAGLLLTFVPGLLALAMLGLMNWVRRRWLWRASGIVKPVRIIVPRRVSVLSAVILVVGMGIAVLLRQSGWVDDTFLLRMLWTATGWSFGYTLFGVGQNIGLTRYVRLGLVGGAVSTILLFLPLAFNQAGLLFGLVWGMLLGASGIVTLRAWLQATESVRGGG